MAPPTPWSRLGVHLEHFLEDEDDPVIGAWAVGQGTNAPDRQLFRHLLRFLVQASGGRPVSVLEVGCGSGIQLQGLLDDGLAPEAVRYTGYDFTPELVDVCRKKFPTHEFQTRDMLGMNDDRTADVVVSRSVLEHVEEGKLGLANLFRATRIVTVVAWFVRPTWNDVEAGIHIADGFVHQRYAIRDLLAFVRELRPALFCRFDFDHGIHEWSVWLLWREPPRDGALAAIHSYLASEEFERAVLPRLSA